MATVQLLLRYTHITAGLLTLSCGLLAMSLPKGTRPHRLAGNVFFGSMVVLASGGIVLSLVRVPNMGNIMGGLTALYMVTTAWTTVLRPPGRTGRSEVVAALGGLVVGGGATALGVQAANSPDGLFYGYPPLMYFIFAGVLFAASALDVRMILRGGVLGLPRTVRHLTRMSLAFFMATASFFFGQPKFVPAFLRDTGLYVVAGLLPLGLMLFFLVRVRVWPAITEWRERARRARPLGA